MREAIEQKDKDMRARREQREQRKTKTERGEQRKTKTERGEMRMRKTKIKTSKRKRTTKSIKIQTVVKTVFFRSFFFLPTLIFIPSSSGEK